MIKLKEKLIPIDNSLLNKYESYKEIFQKEKANKTVYINNTIKELNGIDVNSMSVNELRKLARVIFHNYHNTNIFYNNDNKITVTNNGINESIQKLFYNEEQKNYLLEHLKIYSELGKIIEKSKLVNQVIENKGRWKYKYWNYYVCNAVINNKKYLVEIDVVTTIDKINNYRVHRLNIK